MARYSDVLITTDFDRTLTALDSSIPQRNMEAIRYFMEQGGAFTVNTGRSAPSATDMLRRVRVNAPFLMYNGAAAYDSEKKEFLFCHEIPLSWQAVRSHILEAYPMAWVEFQGVDAHYLCREHPVWPGFCDYNQIPWKYAAPEDDLGPFLKFCVYPGFPDVTLDRMFHGTPEEVAIMDEIEAWLNREYGDCCVVARGADLFIDVQPLGVSKGVSALELKEKLGKKLLICIGDAENDISMLEAADHAYCPAGATVGDRYENVCPCEEGSVADVIYEKIPLL